MFGQANPTSDPAGSVGRRAVSELPSGIRPDTPVDVGGEMLPSVDVGGEMLPSVDVGGEMLPSVDVGGEMLPSVDVAAKSAQFRALAAFAPIAIFQGTAEGQWVYANQAWSEISGLTLQQTVGTGWMRCIHSDDIDALRTLWHKSVRDGDPFEFDFRLVHVAGETRSIRARTPRLLVGNGFILRCRLCRRRDASPRI